MKFFKLQSENSLKPSNHQSSHFGKKADKVSDRSQILLSPLERRNSHSNAEGTGALRSIRRSESRESDTSQKAQKQVRFALPKGLELAMEKQNSEEYEEEVEKKKKIDNQMADMQLYEDEEERNNGTKKGVRELSYIGVSFRKK